MWMSGSHDMIEQNHFQWRLKLIIVIVLACYALIGARLFALQVLQGEQMAQISERNRLQLIFLRAPRGRILDTRGFPLLQNGPSFTLFYSPVSSPSKEVQKTVEDYLLKRFPNDSGMIRKKLDEAHRIRQFVRLAEDLPRPTAFGFIEDSKNLPGVSVSVEARRRYATDYPGSHILGYLGEVTKAELSRTPAIFRLGDLVGRMGVERIYDRFLRGQNGGLEIEVDSAGRQVRLMRRVEPTPGDDLILTIDSSVQAVAEQALAESPTGRGAVVAMDPRTGAVIALASAPRFGAGNTLRESLTDKELPLFNRAVQGAYPLGSCFKMITAMVALEKGAIRPSTRFNCTGSYTLGKRVFRCWKPTGHGWNDLLGAIAVSCDVYFYQVARLLNPEDLEAAAHQFGLGSPVQIDLPGEVSGVVPGPEWALRNSRSWFEGDTLNMSIGQGQVMVTPIQAAVMMCTVANRGTMVKPYLVSEIRGPRGNVVFRAKSEPVRKVEISENTWNILEAGLRKVVDEGTGSQAKIPGWTVYGKTGTAENPHGDDHAWFLCAVRQGSDPPRLVVAVLVENGGHGGTAAVPIAKRVMEAALGVVPQGHENPAPAEPESPPKEDTHAVVQ